MRVALGWILLWHAIAHASVAVFAPLQEPAWLYTLLLTTAFAAYFASGLAILRAPVLRMHWRNILLVASLASMVLLIWLQPAWGMLGIVLDVVLFIATEAVMQPRIDAAIDVEISMGRQASAHPTLVRTGWVLGAAFLIYGTAVLLGHPMIMRWGTTWEERVVQLAGDDALPRDAKYRIDHAITIRAPAERVWPWLVQLGQDRGGFYSYDWLERAIGDHVHNADVIRDEWQQRAVNDTILATQRNYLGGRFGTIGWRVSVLEPGQVIGLENWGNFIVRPVDSTTTRLIVRTRGPGTPTFAGFLLAPINVFAFEPAHFIMERAMLRGIRDRAERAGRVASAGR